MIVVQDYRIVFNFLKLRSSIVNFVKQDCMWPSFSKTLDSNLTSHVLFNLDSLKKRVTVRGENAKQTFKVF